MKLMLLIIPAIQTTVNPSGNGPSSRITPRPERVVDEFDEDAHADREQRQPELTGELPPRPQVEVVVEDAERGRQGAAEQQGDDARRIDGARDRQEVRVAVREPDGRRGDDEGDRRPPRRRRAGWGRR